MKQSWPTGKSEMARRIREHEWADTSLGHCDGWSRRFRIHVETMLASAQATAIFCAPDRIVLYNDAYRATFAGNTKGRLAMHSTRPFRN